MWIQVLGATCTELPNCKLFAVFIYVDFVSSICPKGPNPTHI